MVTDLLNASHVFHICLRYRVYCLPLLCNFLRNFVEGSNLGNSYMRNCSHNTMCWLRWPTNAYTIIFAKLTSMIGFGVLPLGYCILSRDIPIDWQHTLQMGVPGWKTRKVQIAIPTTNYRTKLVIPLRDVTRIFCNLFPSKLTPLGLDVPNPLKSEEYVVAVVWPGDGERHHCHWVVVIFTC